MNRSQAICRLIRAVYMQPDQIEVLIDTFEKQASLMNMTLKSEKDLQAAKEDIRQDAFIEKMNLSLETLSIDEINSLATFYESDLMKKFRLSNDELSPIYQTLTGAFIKKTP